MFGLAASGCIGQRPDRKLEIRESTRVLRMKSMQHYVECGKQNGMTVGRGLQPESGTIPRSRRASLAPTRQN